MTRDEFLGEGWGDLYDGDFVRSLDALLEAVRTQALEEAAQACETKAAEHRDLEAVFKTHGKPHAAAVHRRYAQVLAAGGDSAAVRIRALAAKEPRK